MLAAILAAPTPGPPLPAPASVGPVGEWFLPAVVIGLALLLDATAAGPAAKRDRVAAALTYTGTLGMISVYGWADDIQSWIGSSWSMTVAGSALAFLAHVALLLVLAGDRFGPTKRIAAWLQGRACFDHKDGNAVGRLNSGLHLRAAVVACTYVLARGDAAVVPKSIGTALTHASGLLGMWAVHKLGG